MYSQDGLGLGHLHRTRNIARAILARDRRASVLIISDSWSLPAPSAGFGVDYIKLPTLVKVATNDWRTGSLPARVHEMLDLRASIILETFRRFCPDHVLIDHLPVGAAGELKPMLDEARRRAKPPRLFLGLRDVLDAPETIRAAWDELDAYDYLPLYDAVLVYGCRDIFDSGAAYALTPHARSVEYCGYVTSQTLVRAAREPHAQSLVLVMGGGGSDAFPLAHASLAALIQLSRTVDLQVLIVTGPNMPDSHRETLSNLAGSHGMQVQARVDDLPAVMASASAVVTMAGYNSLCEVLALRKKALVVPRWGPSAEQRIRSELFAARGLIRKLEPEAVTPERLAAELRELLATDGIPNGLNIPPLDGALKAASIIAAEEPGGVVVSDLRDREIVGGYRGAGQ